MPVVDGWEAARRLKGKLETRAIPIIGLSAHALAGERKKRLLRGRRVRYKPVDFELLLAKIRRLLGATSP